MLNRENQDWLDGFTATHGRAPRILHLGNIANNAYLNAKMLNLCGIECDVLCYDYYHIMGCPEWEDADFTGEVSDQFKPDWDNMNLNGYQRPVWFLQGSLDDCLNRLAELRGCGKSNIERYVDRLLMKLSKFNRVDALAKINEKLGFLNSKTLILGDIVTIFTYFAALPLIISSRIYFRLVKYKINNKFKKTVEHILNRYAQAGVKYENNDFSSYQQYADMMKEIFCRYDVVHGYATDGIFPLISGVKYVAYEHGTIRNIPFENTLQGRLCALTYRAANQVLITNADNIAAAKKLGLKDYSFIPHPVNEEHLAMDENARDLRLSLREDLESDFIIFHPSRQHWDSLRHPDWEKGNDIFIEGFAQFVKEVNPAASAIFIEWGGKVQESKDLLDRLGIAERVMWLPPMPNRQMIRYIHATDVLADQFYLGSFGSTTPKALACGKPVLLKLDEDVHRWCFDEMPPVINVSRPDQVNDGLKAIYLDSAKADMLAESGRSWYEKYHSNKIIVNKLISTYGKVMANPSLPDKRL